MSERFKRVRERISPELKQKISKSFDISDQILYILERKGISQKELAKRLGKTESEISKWMRGDHNFTIETIVKIEIALDEKIIDTPKNFSSQNIRSNHFNQVEVKMYDLPIMAQRITGLAYASAPVSILKAAQSTASELTDITHHGGDKIAGISQITNQIIELPNFKDLPCDIYANLSVKIDCI